MQLCVYLKKNIKQIHQSKELSEMEKSSEQNSQRRNENLISSLKGSIFELLQTLMFLHFTAKYF